MPRREQALKVFVASPGDVAEERELVKKTIDQFNLKASTSDAHKRMVMRYSLDSKSCA